MKLWDFLKEKLLFLLVEGGAVFFVGLLLYSLDLGAYLTFFVTVLLLLAFAFGLLYEYMKKNQYYKSVKNSLDSLDQKYLLSELLERPDFYDGVFFYEVLKTVSKAMNDKIAELQEETYDYREYIETWVHEVKTPIASSRLIIENNKNSVTQSLLEELLKIEGFVQQALYYARSNSVEKDYLIKSTPLLEAVRSAVKKNAPAFIQSRVSVYLNDLDGEVFTDVKWLDFILCQLISNAIKYRRKDNARLDIYARESEQSVSLFIRDNGIGIPPQDVDRVFDKGFTGENGRRHGKATGIGLYLCQKLCKKLGLDLELNSKVGEGTVVHIRFPKSRMYLLDEQAQHRGS